MKVTLNPYGPKISSNQIDVILKKINPSPQNTVLINQVESFFEIPANKMTKEMLQRYVKVHKVIKLIALNPVYSDISDKLTGTIKSAIKCFCYN